MKKLVFIILFFSALTSFSQSQSGCVTGDCENGFGIYVWPAGSEWTDDKYSGYWKDGKMDGYGTYQWHAGNKYEGHWTEGAQDGKGTFYKAYSKDGETGIWRKGSKTTETSTASWISGGCYSGFGIYEWANGDRYEGNYISGERSGQGTLYFATGEKYVGNYANSKRNGYGTFYWLSGDYYIGNWKDGNMNGYGTKYYINGTTKAGTWKDGSFTGSSTVNNNVNNKTTGCISGDCANGYGIATYKNGKYVGDWKNSLKDGQGTYTFHSGDKYVGAYKNDKRNGKGTYTWSDGESYNGDWKDDQYDGIGTFYYKDGTTKTGIWKDSKFVSKTSEYTGCITGDCNNGYGVYVWKSGEKYDGYWKADKRDGQGINYFPSGIKYDGEWKADNQNGYGTTTYVDGTVKTGLYENGVFVGSGQNNYGCISGNCDEGYGVRTWEGGIRYEGYFKNSEPNGQGTCTWETGEKYVGEWKNTKRNGYGYTTYTDGTQPKSGFWENDVFISSKSKTTGCISGDCKDGFGTYMYDTGGKYVGTFSGSELSGQGTYTAPDGEKYVGEFKSSTYNGQGTYTDTNGNKYIGEWKDGSYDGIGTYYFADGSTKDGIWSKGVYVGPKESNVKPPIVSWVTPQYTSTTSENAEYTVSICIKSKTDLKNVQIYVNDKLQVNNATRGFTVVSTGCDYTKECKITLAPGDNQIKAVVENTGGTASSDIRTVTFKQQQMQQNEKRLALVIGNGNYTVSPLKNPANDARAIAAALKEVGFEVMLFTDMGQSEMKLKIRAFGDKITKDKGVGLFYFAGHGIQLKGENYLIPVDAKIEKEQDVELESVNIKRILGEMDYAQNPLNILILDACRNNPFARSFRSTASNGLAPTNAPAGTFVAFATAPESVAADGVGNNGLYTEELLAALKKPGLKIEDVFKQVRVNVVTKSDRKQVPWENSSILGDFYFRR